MRIGAAIRRAALRSVRGFADLYLWTHPNIVATFQCRPTYLAAFKNTWQSLLWAAPRRRRLLRLSRLGTPQDDERASLARSYWPSRSKRTKIDAKTV